MTRLGNEISRIGSKIQTWDDKRLGNMSRKNTGGVEPVEETFLESASLFTPSTLWVTIEKTKILRNFSYAFDSFSPISTAQVS